MKYVIVRKKKIIIRESSSEYSSPILLVKKKNGTDRMCVVFWAWRMRRLSINELFQTTLRSLIDKGSVLVYIDNVLILSSSVNEGLQVLRQVLETLTVSVFSINLKKMFILSYRSRI